MNNVKSKRAYKAYTTFTNVVTVKRHHITNDASINLLKRRIPALLQFFTTNHLRGLHHLQCILLWYVMSRLAVTSGDRRPSFSPKLGEYQKAPTCNKYVRYLSFT